MSQTPLISDLSLLSEEAKQCPFHVYETLRRSSPIHIDPITGYYVVTRYEDIRSIAEDTENFSNRTGLMAGRGMAYEKVRRLYEEEGFLYQDTLVSADPPEHAHYRKLVDKAFNAIKVRAAEDFIRETIDGLINALPLESFDFVQRFAVPLPVTVIAHQLGVQGEEMAEFKRWSDALIGSANEGLSEDQQFEFARAIITMQKFFKRRIDQARRSPDETLLSALVHATIDGVGLTDRALVSILQQLLVAGNETTTNALAAAVQRLADDPVLQQRLREKPELIRNYCEEVLRLDAPLQGLFRRAIRTTSISGVEIPEGAIINLRWGSGNRDEGRYEHPETLDTQRNGITQHLTFGAGIHFCIGNQLARAELRIAVSRLLDRSRSIRLADVREPVGRHVHFIVYGISRLELEYLPA
jgi:cytochrome P450